MTSRRSHGIGDIADRFETVILRLDTNQGLTGWGEATPWAPFAGTPEASFAALSNYLHDALACWSPGQTARAMTHANHALAGHWDAKAALETALLDLDGQAMGKPLWSLLGGTASRPIDLSISIANPDWDADIALMDRAYGAGLRLFKFKGGFADHAFDVMRIEAARARFADARLRLDYNQGLSRDAALDAVPRLDGLGLDFIEQPVAARDWATMAELAGRIKTPLLADESVFDALDLDLAIERRIAQGVSVKIAKAGGPRAGLNLIRRARAAGWDVYGGDMFETGISHLAGLHMLTAAGGCALGCEYYHANWHLVRDVLDPPFQETAGRVRAPDGPGLGQRIDAGIIAAQAIDQAEFRPS